MKIGFCSSPLSSGHQYRGIGAYTKALLKYLKDQKEIEVKEFSGQSLPEGVDVIHYPFFDLFTQTLPFIKKYPTVVTIHDVIPLSYPQYYPAGIKGYFNNLLQKLSLKNIAAVITDSTSSREEIIKYLGIPEYKIYPISLAPAPHFKKIDDREKLEKVENKYKLPEQFVLYTGNVNWNKNLLNLTEAALKAETDIVMVGKSFEEKDNIDHPEMRSFKEFLKIYSGNSRVRILGFIEDEDLAAITNLTQAVLLPSFAEGFGLPILEAQACGAPVVTSNVSSMPEVAGKAALFVDPNSVESISEAIIKIREDENIRKTLIKEGLENTERFSWEKTAKETIAVYEKVSQPG